MGEARLIHRAAGGKASILELGCGVGRVTRQLARLGHSIVAVDNSGDMLRYVRGATEKVLADIESLRLSRQFDAVVLASHLVNTAPRMREAFLLTCREHVRNGGVVIIERLDPAWANPAAALERARPRIIRGFRYSLHDMRHKGSRWSATVRYERGGTQWVHSFTADVLDDRALLASLAAARLEFDRWLDVDRTWLTATPIERA